jgi:tetratricopeptide (TPR) repeat protein
MLAAAFAFTCALPAAAQVPVPAVPVTPLRLDIQVPDVHIDTAELRAIQENARAIAESMREFRGFEFSQQPPAQIAPPMPPLPPPAPMSPFNNKDSEDAYYDRGRGYIDRSQYDRAVESFNQVINRRSAKADAAMYWKAYSLNKLARRTEAQAALAELQKQFPKGKWVDDARKLDVEIRQSSGQPVSADALDDEELKLLVLQGLTQSNPEVALPHIEKMLAGPGSVRLKERALYLASRSRSPRGRQVVTAAAKSSTNPDLQMSAITYLGRMSGPESGQALEDIYRSTSDTDVRKRILQSLASANAEDRLGPIARGEKDPELKRMAIRQLGASRRADVGPTLTAIYNDDSSIEARRAVIDALAQNSRNEGAVKALVDLARVEKNNELRTNMVRRLSQMQSPVATDFMLEMLAK